MRLEKKLNKKGKLGFRVSGRSVTTHVVGLERPGETPPRMTYRALSSKKVEGLSEVLDQALQEGYGFLALLVSADEIVLVVGKATDRELQRFAGALVGWRSHEHLLLRGSYLDRWREFIADEVPWSSLEAALQPE